MADRILEEKYKKLQDYLRTLGRVAVGFSSGVDSAFLLKAAVDTLGSDNVLAITATASWFPERERGEAQEFCQRYGITQHMMHIEAESIEGFKENPVNRCYHCKKAIFGNALKMAKEKGFDYIAEGSNMDDNGDYRPGHIAINELGIKSPLREAGLYKAEIRELSKEMGLPTYKKPSFACLASRFVYGETITDEKLSMVEQAEELLISLGFEQFRVRLHGEKDYMARIEVLENDFSKLMEKDVRDKVYSALKELGFSYIAMDLKGYRTGSMNETILKKA